MRKDSLRLPSCAESGGQLRSTSVIYPGRDTELKGQKVKPVVVLSPFYFTLIVILLLLVVVFATGSCPVVQAVLNSLCSWPVLALTSQRSSCSSLLSAEIPGMCHYNHLGHFK